MNTFLDGLLVYLLFRSLDEGKERLDKVQQEVQVIKDIKGKLDNQKEQIRGAVELLATHHRKIAHLEGCILTETRQAELTEKEKDEVFKHLKIIKDLVSSIFFNHEDSIVFTEILQYQYMLMLWTHW